MIKKLYLLIICLLLSVGGLFANKPDSVYINGNWIQLIYLTDSIPIVRDFYFGSYFEEWQREPEVSEDRLASESNMETWHTNPQRVFAYDDFAFHKDFDSVLIGNRLNNYIFFAPDRFIETDISITPTIQIDGKDFIRCKTNNWLQYSIDSLNTLLLPDANWYMKSAYGKNYNDIRVDNLIIPLKGNRYFSDSIVTLQPDTLNGDYRALLWSRQQIHDVDTFSVNGKYGLYTTFTKKEVIPAIYDSLKTDEVYVRAFDGKKTIIFDYMGNIVKENIKRAYPVRYRYRVLDNNNEVYWMDRDGQRHENYQYSVMSVDDMMSTLPFDIVLTPPKKKAPGKKRNYHWVKFIYQWNRKEKEEYEFSDWRTVGLESIYESGVYALIDKYDKETFSNDKKFYHNSYSLYINHYSLERKLPDYNFEVYEIPLKYKNQMLVSGEDELHRSGDFRSLNEYWVIVKYKRKYGVIDARYPERPVLPFIYDKIEANNISLTLYRDGLKCYYPISKTPRYKELSPFLLRDPFICFTLPDGEKGWLLKSGEEFLDNETL